MIQLAVISDTHGKLCQDCVDIIKSCDYVIHAGDFGTEKCYKQIKSIGTPMYMVKGNCDKGIWAVNIPDILAFRIDKLNFYLIHNIRNLPYNFPKSDIIISGHTHVYNVTDEHNVMYLNPGSCSSSRPGSKLTMMILRVTGYDVEVDKKYINN